MHVGGLVFWPTVSRGCPQSGQGGTERLSLFEANYKAVFQFVAADILEPVAQQNGEAAEMYQSQQIV